MTDTRELPNSCPFCGSNRAVVDATDEALGTMAAECLGCHCSGPVGGSYAEAIRLWNERKGDEANQVWIAKYKGKDTPAIFPQSMKGDND